MIFRKTTENIVNCNMLNINEGYFFSYNGSRQHARLFLKQFGSPGIFCRRLLPSRK